MRQSLSGASIRIALASTLLLATTLVSFPSVSCFSTPTAFTFTFTTIKTAHLQTNIPQRTTFRNAFNYGRGADIWPECNEDPVQLQDSFPNGQIPYSAIMAMDLQDMQADHKSYQETPISSSSTKSKSNKNIKSNNASPGAEDVLNTNGRRRRVAKFFVSQTVRRLLRRAAAREELDQEQAAIDVTPGVWENMPAVVAIAVVLVGWIRPLDVLAVASLTAYIQILTMVARSDRSEASSPSSSLTPIMPNMPPQGHVPYMVSNPLGRALLCSRNYALWLKLGVGLGLVAPLANIVLAYYLGTKSKLENPLRAIRYCARPLFLLCCQAQSEAFSRKATLPLPIRILIPMAYNTVLLAYLAHWATAPLSAIGWSGRILAMSNLVYWTLNLLAFLIPVALVRYMRAYFFGVEAAEVTTRFGMEETLGLISNLQ